MKTVYAESMARISKRIAGFLKSQNFKKKQHTFNRYTPDDLVQVINLQMGISPVGNHADAGVASQVHRLAADAFSYADASFCILDDGAQLIVGADPVFRGDAFPDGDYTHLRHSRSEKFGRELLFEKLMGVPE